MKFRINLLEGLESLSLEEFDVMAKKIRALADMPAIKTDKKFTELHGEIPVDERWITVRCSEDFFSYFVTDYSIVERVHTERANGEYVDLRI